VQGCSPRVSALAVIDMSANPMSTDGDASPQEAQSQNDSEQLTEKVERTDVGVSVSCKLKRGTGTRDQDEISAKVKAETVAEAKADLDEFKPYLQAFVQEIREIQPSAEGEE